MCPDVDILKCVRAKDREAFDIFYDKYAPVLYGVIIKLIPDILVANYVLRKSFERMITQTDLSMGSESNFIHWMLKIAINECNKVAYLSNSELAAVLGRTI